MESAEQHACQWGLIEGGANIATAYSIADAIELVRKTYRFSGARIFIAGSVYQAGAASIILSTGNAERE